MKRRNFLMFTAAGLASASAGPLIGKESGYEVTRTKAEWREMLNELEYSVMREEATERAFTSPLLEIKDEGTYHCKGCDQALYSSKTKYESGTGWPSYYDVLPNAIGTKEDRKLLFGVRTECHCDRCGSHLGHIFDDGPAPTGKRHCINGVSLVFKAAKGDTVVSG